MGITIDWSQAEDSGFEPVEPGEYAATLVKCTLSDKTGQSGYKYIEFEYQCNDPKRKFWDRCSLSPKALWKLKAALQALNVDVSDGEMDFEPEDVIGQNVTLVIGLESYNGKPSNNVQEVKPGAEFSWS